MTHNNNVVKSVCLCEITKLAKKARNERRRYPTQPTIAASTEVSGVTLTSVCGSCSKSVITSDTAV